MENTLDFAWPTVGADPTVWRQPRDQSALSVNAAVNVTWVNGMYYRLRVTAKYFGYAQNFGALGLQAFIDWAADSNAFTLVPNLAVPAHTVQGCYLEGPFMRPSISLESDSSHTLELIITHPTQDLGLAWRGLYFEYDAGGSLIDPLAYTFTRANAGYETNWQGYLNTLASGVLGDGHYPSPFANGVQTTVLSPAVTNDITNPEALGAWTPTEVTIAANGIAAPDTVPTADKIIESVTVGVGHSLSSNTWTVVAGDKVTVLAFVRSGGRFRGRIYIADNLNTSRCGVDFNMDTDSVVNHVNGSGVVDAATLTPLANGWHMLWWRGTVDGTSTTMKMVMTLMDGTGATTYTGDGVQGTYLWGATAVHGSTNSVIRYTPTSSVKDVLTVGVPTGLVPQAMFVFVSLVECGARYAPAANFPAPLTIGSFTAPNWRTILYYSGGANHYNFANGNSVSQANVSASITDPSVGQLAEFLGLVFADGSVKLIQAIAGGAEAASAQTGPPATAIPTSYGVLTIQLGDSGGYGTDCHQIANIKVGPLGALPAQTIAAARFV